LLWTILAGALVAVIIAFVAILSLVIGTLTQPVVTTGDAFMTTLKTGDYTRAYALCTPDLQQELGSVPALSALVDGYRLGEGNWTSRSIRNGVGQLDGSLTYAGGRSGTAHLTLRQVGNDWRIDSFRMNPNP